MQPWFWICNMNTWHCTHRNTICCLKLGELNNCMYAFVCISVHTKLILHIYEYNGLVVNEEQLTIFLTRHFSGSKYQINISLDWIQMGYLILKLLFELFSQVYKNLLNGFWLESKTEFPAISEMVHFELQYLCEVFTALVNLKAKYWITLENTEGTLHSRVSIYSHDLILYIKSRRHIVSLVWKFIVIFAKC